MELRSGLGIGRFDGWISKETSLKSIMLRLSEEPSNGAAAWARTTSGLLALLLILQTVTGFLLAFHYVPSTTTAYTTVSYLEMAVNSGSWIRSLHYHSSVLLPVVLVLHLGQMLVRGAFKTNRSAWIFAVMLLGLILASGATGYALPWDARSLNGVNIAASLTANVPLIGPTAGKWLINGTTISTLTLSRFYGIHVFALPALIAGIVICRIFVFAKSNDDSNDLPQSPWLIEQLFRNAVVIGVVFAGIALFSSIYPAPLGPPPLGSASYLPRPGPQFLWLFELQKWTDGAAAALLALGFPGLILGGLTLISIVPVRHMRYAKFGSAAVFLVGFGTVGILTSMAIYDDLSDSRISSQLAKQEKEEADLRRSGFEPKVVGAEHLVIDKELSHTETSRASSPADPVRIPETYVANCAKCHGSSGEGTAKFPELVGITERSEDPLTPEMVLAIINDPKSVGYSSKMPAYKNKLSESEKSEIVNWIRSLRTDSSNDQSSVTTASIDETKK